ncbi:hypothetical protein [Pedobacter sp.]|uniref:hypothetical protein n=1 Tax=Pedobacter sp. TaxID=1411316 RepID=UPI00396C3C43
MKKRTTHKVEELTKNKIETIDQARRFISECFHELKLNFHPDTPFEDYRTSQGKARFNEQEQQLLERSLDDCLNVCEREKADIYKVCLEEWRKKPRQRLRM